MRAVVIYRPVSEHGRTVDEFAHEFVHRYPRLHIELQNIDGRDGGSTATMYDITSYPAILVLRDDGSCSMTWQGQQLPLLDEVAGYLSA